MTTWEEFKESQPKDKELTFRSFLRESGPKDYNLDKIIAEDDIIREMAIAGKGDWNPSNEMIAAMSVFILEKNWNYINELVINSTTYRIYKQKNVYIAGYFIENQNNETKFEIDFEIKLSEDTDVKHDFRIRNKVMNVDNVRVKETARGYGIATALYKFLVKKEGYVILGDEVQFFGARRLWAKLSKEIDVRVDIIDLYSETYLEKDVILKHGTDDWDFDKRVWSYDYDKKYIRLILKEIK